MRVNSLDEDVEASDELMQGNALIRAHFHLDPSTMDAKEWTMRVCEASWLEAKRKNDFAEIYAAFWNKEQ